MTLGEKIRQLRLRSGKEISQQDLAEKIGIEVTYLSKIENGRVEPYLSEERLKRIAETLDLNENEEGELYGLAKKLQPFVKEQAARKSVNDFLRTASELSDKTIEGLIKKYKK